MTTAQMYMTTSYVISKYAGMQYADFVKERIWDRLNMSSTTFSPITASKDGRLTQSWTKRGRRLPFWFTEDAIELNAGPGGVITNVEDTVGLPPAALGIELIVALC